MVLPPSCVVGMSPADFRGWCLSSACDRELQVVPTLLWLHFVYLTGCGLGPVLPLGACPTLLLAATKAAEMCVLWAAGSLPGTADASLRVSAPRKCEVRAWGSAGVA